MSRTYLFTAHLLLSLYLSPLLPAAGHANARGDWRSYGGAKTSSKYAPLEQITPDNVADLQLSWRWNSIDNPVLEAHPELWTMVFEGTPLQVGDRLYVSTSLNQVAAIDAQTGKTVWTYDPGTWRSGTPANVGLVHRGVSYCEDGDDRRVLFGTGDAYLIALDAATGQPLPRL